MSDQKNIFAAFVKAQQAFAPALKTSVNPHFKSRYADLAACVEAVIDALNDNGIGLVQKSHPDDTGVTVETLFVHTSGESMSGGTLHVPAAKQDAQGYGSALSYCRRYSLMAACGIAPEDDDGNAATKPAAKAPAKPATVEQPKAITMAEMEIIAETMGESDSLGDLQTVFGASYIRANEVQKKIIKAQYETVKASFQKVPA